MNRRYRERLNEGGGPIGTGCLPARREARPHWNPAC